MKIGEHKAMALCKHFEIPTVNHYLIETSSIPVDDWAPMKMPVAFQKISLQEKSPTQRVEEEEDLIFFVENFFQSREKGDKIFIKELPIFKEKIFVDMGINYQAGSVFLRIVPCKGALVKEIEMEMMSEQEISQHQFFEFVRSGGFQGHVLNQMGRLLFRMTHMFFQADLTEVKLSPVHMTLEGDVLVGGVKMEMDDAALSRQEKVLDFYRGDQENDLLREFRQASLVYRAIDLQGEVGVIASGIGLTLSSLDYVVQAGLSACGSLVLGGGILEEKMASGVRLMKKIKGIQGILINVFGGANSCEIMAKGIATGLEEEPQDIPIIVKMTGHDQEEGWRVLEEAGLFLVRSPSSELAVESLKKLTLAERK